jgi:predicted RNA-binding Zn ribbon-like protein
MDEAAVPPAQPEPMPSHVALLRSFANTIDPEFDTETFTTPAALTIWLQGAGLAGRRAKAAGEDLACALALRAGLRRAMAAHHGESPAPYDPEFEAATQQLPLRLTLTRTGPRPTPVDDGVRGALGQILVAVLESQADGSWRRMKICPASTCLVAFYDRTKNRSRTWCSMEVCGNRTKTRAYRARRAATS